MIKIEKTSIMNFENAIRGMRNPMNSWKKSDSVFEYAYGAMHTFKIGENDLGLMMKLRNAGSDHRKFMRMIMVSVDITAPLYWWKEFDTYKVGTVANSCSTMHKIHDKDLTFEDFSCEHLDQFGINCLRQIIAILNYNRRMFIEAKDKESWYQMIQLLPTSYNQKRTVMLNYEVLLNMYHSRKAHKLEEWREFCKWIEELPYSELITGKGGEGK